MKLLKIVLAMAFICFAADFVRGDVLYWQLTGKPTDSLSLAYKDAVEKAAVISEDTPIVMRLFSTDVTPDSNHTISSAATRSYITTSPIRIAYDEDMSEFLGAVISSAIETTSGLSFGVEMGIWNATDGTVTALYISDVMTYGKLSEIGAIQDMVTTGYDQPWNLANSNWHAVPEPTSGVLMLFGCSVLLLRRKRHA